MMIMAWVYTKYTNRSEKEDRLVFYIRNLAPRSVKKVSVAPSDLTKYAQIVRQFAFKIFPRI